MNTISSEASPICLNIVNSEMDGPKMNSHRGAENTYKGAERLIIVHRVWAENAIQGDDMRKQEGWHPDG